MAKNDSRALKAELAKLRAENEALKNKKRELKLKVAQSGGVSLYGLGRFPVTLYKEQWELVIKMVDEIEKFIAQNAAQLKVKE